jgi:hypothetical protein
MASSPPSMGDAGGISDGVTRPKRIVASRQVAALNDRALFFLTRDVSGR